MFKVLNRRGCTGKIVLIGSHFFLWVLCLLGEERFLFGEERFLFGSIHSL